MAKKEMNLDDVVKFTRNAASMHGWAVNPEEDFHLSIAEGLLVNYNRYGYFQCPCREAWGEREKDRDVICPCSYCADDIKEYGHCYCALYMSEDFIKSGAEPGSIPERRPDELAP